MALPSTGLPMSLPADVRLIAATAVILLAIGVSIAVQRSGDDLLAGDPVNSGALPETDPGAGQPTTPTETPATNAPTTTPTTPASPDPTSAPTNGEVADQMAGIDESTHLPNTGAGLVALGLVTGALGASGMSRRRPL